MQQTVAYSVAPDSSPVRFLHSLTLPAHTPRRGSLRAFRRRRRRRRQHRPVWCVVIHERVVVVDRGEDDEEEEDDDAYGEHSHVGYYSE